MTTWSLTVWFTFRHQREEVVQLKIGSHPGTLEVGGR